MKSSRFNVALLDYPEPGGMLLYNTLCQEFVELEPAYRKTLEKLERGEDSFSPVEIERLKEMEAAGFVVPDAAFETAKAANWLRSLEYLNTGTYQATVVTTMACNLACVYCLENSVKTNETMSIETAEKTFDWITRQVTESPTNHVAIGYYGGEPLLNLEVVELLSASFKEWCAKKGKTFAFSLSTNGTLLTRDVVTRLRPLGLRLAQISVDGLPDVHDARRPFKHSRESSFQAIMKNIRDCLDLIKINLAGCYSDETEAQVPRFLDYLASTGLAEKLNAINFDRETPYLGKDGSACGKNAKCNLAPKHNLQNELALRREMLNRNLRLDKSFLNPSSCSLALNHDHVIIAPEGTIYKCPALVGQAKYAVGHVDQAQLGWRHHEYMAKELWKKCLDESDCPFVYMCGNACGCRYKALLREGDLWSLACEREYFEQAVPEFMKLEYERLSRLEAQAAAPEGEKENESSGQASLQPVLSNA